MKQQTVKIMEQLDRNLYKDNHNRKIFINFKKNEAFIIPKSEEKRFVLIQARLVLGVTIGILLGSYVNLYLGIGAGILITVGLEYYYRKKFLPNLEQVSPESIPEKYPLYVNMAEGGKPRIIVSLLCIIALPIVTVLNAMQQLEKNNYTWNTNMIILVIGSVALIGYTTYMGYNTIKALIYLAKKEKK